MKKILTTISLSLLLTLTLSSCDRHKVTTLYVDKNAGSNYTPPENSLKKTCPEASTLTKDPNTNLWSAPHGYKSYDASFVTQISTFTGAQWNGAGIGQIICVYESPHTATNPSFPITLFYNVLSFEPQTNNWGKNEGGVRNCVSNTTENCPFYIKKKEKKQDIYQEVYDLHQSKQ